MALQCCSSCNAVQVASRCIQSSPLHAGSPRHVRELVRAFESSAGRGTAGSGTSSGVTQPLQPDTSPLTSPTVFQTEPLHVVSPTGALRVSRDIAGSDIAMTAVVAAPVAAGGDNGAYADTANLESKNQPVPLEHQINSVQINQGLSAVAMPAAVFAAPSIIGVSTTDAAAVQQAGAVMADAAAPYGQASARHMLHHVCSSYLVDQQYCSHPRGARNSRSVSLGATSSD